MLDNIITNKVFITIFLFSPFVFLIFFYIGTLVTKDKITSALVINIFQTALLYNLTHILIVVLVFIGGKDIYHNIFYGDRAQIFWLAILLSLTVNLYLDVTNYNARAFVIQLVVLIISAIAVIIIVKGIVPGVFYLTDKISSFINDLATFSPR